MEHIFIDKETGESIDESVELISSSSVTSITTKTTTNNSVSNVETGEPEIITTQRRKFKIPNREDNCHRNKKKWNKQPRFLNVIPSGTNFGQMNPIFLSLPAIIYYRWFGAALIIFEVIFHSWTHSKNKSLKNSGVYYRSPFHGITAEFCAICQYELRMDRIRKIQQIRLHKFFQHCHYMKTI